MRQDLATRYVAALVTTLMFFHVARAAEKLPAADAYNERLKTIIDKALHSALMKHPNLNGVAMKIHYAIDRDGHVHNVKVRSQTHDSSAEKIVANTLAGITFPPIPIAAQLEIGAGYFEVDAEVTLATDALSVEKAETPAYYNYRMQVHKIMQDDLEPSFHAPHHLEVDYEFYLDSHGALTSMKVHAKAGGRWAERVVARSIRRIKCPPIPPTVFKELKQKPPLKIDGTMTWDPQSAPTPQASLGIPVAKRTLIHNFFQGGEIIWVGVGDYSSGPKVTVVTVNMGSNRQRSFKLSETQFNELWASFKSSGADKYAWRPDARQFDIEHYYLFIEGDQTYLVPGKQASPTLLSLVRRMRAYAK